MNPIYVSKQFAQSQNELQLKGYLLGKLSCVLFVTCKLLLLHPCLIFASETNLTQALALPLNEGWGHGQTPWWGVNQCYALLVTSTIFRGQSSVSHARTRSRAHACPIACVRECPIAHAHVRQRMPHSGRACLIVRASPIAHAHS